MPKISWWRIYRCQVLYAEGKAVQVELPASVSLKVIESAEGVRGDTASNVTKPAKLETGKTINVPLFIKEGETIKIDTAPVPTWAAPNFFFVIPREYASPTRSEESLAIPQEIFRDSSTSLDMTK